MTRAAIPDLHELLSAETAQAVEPQIVAISDQARARYGDNVCAVLFYGSCLRRGYRDDDVVDLYLIVDGYRHPPIGWVSAALNWLLPPNVIYLEATSSGATVRAKCAIISLADFDRGVSGRWFHSYMWARFAQPCRFAYVRDNAVTERILRALQGAVRTMVRETSPLMVEPFNSRNVWIRALQETYRAELRAEGPDRAVELVDEEPDRYAAITGSLTYTGEVEVVVEAPPTEARYRAGKALSGQSVAQFRWFLRRILGKILSGLRLIKAAFTFVDGAVYILWKIKRHSGVAVELTDWQRRHPILASTTLFWRLYRKGAFK